MRLSWNRYDHASIDAALSQSCCLYILHHPDDGDRPFYIGKAKYFGTKQPTGYKASARYNSGYVHLVAGMLGSGFVLYIAPIGEEAFRDAESYEQELIARWDPVCAQRTKAGRKAVEIIKPWNDG